MYSGWFKFMILDGDARLTYKLDDGSTIFSNASLSDATFNPTGINNKKRKGSVPFHFRSHDGKVSQAEKEAARDQRDSPVAIGAERRTKRDLVAASQLPRECQIRKVGRRDEQDEAGHRDEQAQPFQRPRSLS